MVLESELAVVAIEVLITRITRVAGGEVYISFLAFIR